MSLRETLSNYWYAFQQELFPKLEAQLAPLSERYQLFVAVVEFVRLRDPAARPPRLARTTAAGPRSTGAPLSLPKRCSTSRRHAP